MSEELEFCSCKLCVRGDDLDPQQVTILLGVEPTDAYRKGEHLRFPPKHKDAGKPSSLIVQSGMWRLEVDKEKKWEWTLPRSWIIGASSSCVTRREFVSCGRADTT